jgi:hypothetical protein
MGGKGSGGHTRKREGVPLAQDRKPFERQPKETDPAWKAFQIYRDMDKRSHAKLGDQLGKSKQLISTWSSKWRWVERCVAWDREADDRARAATLEEIDEMQRRHVQLALGMQQLGALEMQRLLRDANKKAEGEGAGLTAADVHRLIDAGSKLERLNRGEPTDIERKELTGRDGSPLNTLSDDARLKRIEHLLQRRKV